MTREQIADKAIELVKQNKVTILELCTGLGKTKIALDIINTLKGKWLIVLAEHAHYQNWIDEIQKWGYEDLLHNIEFKLYASLHKLEGKEFYGIVYDEAHRLQSDKRMEAHSNIKKEKIVMLSATINNGQLISYGYEKPYMRKLYDKNTFNIHVIKENLVIFSVFLQQAIYWNIIPEPKVYVIELELDSTNKSENVIIKKGKGEIKIEDVLTNKWNYIGKKASKYKNHTITLKCTQQEKYDYINEMLTWYQNKYYALSNKAKHSKKAEDLKAASIMENLFLQQGTKRKAYIASLKIPAAKQILEIIRDKRFICFAASIQDIKELGGDNAVHSKRKDNQEVINAFNNKEINSLFAVGMLQEGVNLVDIEAGLIVQLSGQERFATQTIGRTLRADDPIQYILYIKDTQDEKYLDRVYENINKDYIIKTNIEEL